MGGIGFVFLDIGGVLYDDAVYAEAWRRALREAGASFDDDAFDREYAACKAAQSRSFRRSLATAFIGPDADLAELERRAARYWDYPPTALHPDARPCLDVLRAHGYRMGVIANQPSRVRDAMARDGLVPYFEVWGVSDDLGLRKPDPELFVHAVRTARVEPARAVMVGDRLDYDVRPAAVAGMRTIWLLRGEAPDDPTIEQLAEPDATIETLDELPAALEAFA